MSVVLDRRLTIMRTVIASMATSFLVGCKRRGHEIGQSRPGDHGKMGVANCLHSAIETRETPEKSQEDAWGEAICRRSWAPSRLAFVG
jgi:hypothetical protein